MSNTLKGFTINEGFTDLGNLSIDICGVENPIVPVGDNNENVPQPPRTNIFRLVDTEGNALPDGMKVVFNINQIITGEAIESISYIVKEGFVGLEVPILPTVIRKADGSIFAQADINPPYDTRSEECYLSVLNADNEEVYTLSTGFGVEDGRLGVYTDDNSFFKLSQVINIGPNISALYFSKKAFVYEYNITSQSWTRIAPLNFTQIQYPENLVSTEEGIYKTTETTGILTLGLLGSDTFEKFFIELRNPEVYYYDLQLKVYEEDGDEPIYTGFLENLKPGDLDYRNVTVNYTPTPKEDNTPTLDDLETLSGLEFSSDFKTFLVTQGLTTMKSLADVGPVAYIRDVPEFTKDDDKLQSYVDLYGITEDLAFAKRLTSIGFNNVYDIANTPRGSFVDQVIDGSNVINIYKAGEIHHKSTQQFKLFSNIVGAAIMDFKLAENLFQKQGEVISQNNTYGEHFANTYLNSCSCDDCKSSVSPFAYLTDLIKYAAHHVKKTGSGAYNPTNYNQFISLLKNKFFQPYDTLPVTCDTLHEEFCRVRLVTEVLEKLVLASAGTISAAKLNQLIVDRKNYLQVTYNTLLTQAGTSLDEVRSVYIEQDEEEKEIKARKLSNKLEIPLYKTGSSTFTVLGLYLVFASDVPVENQLTADRLETIFGYRSTLRAATSATPLSDVEKWRAEYLRDTWKNMDYPLSVYTREGVFGSYKSSWMPIVDPDIVGLGDMGYAPTEVVKKLWLHRKKYTDTFLDYFTSDSNVVLNTIGDIQNRIIRVKGVDITKHIIENNEIKLIGGTPDIFHVFNRSLVNTDTNLILKSGSGEPALFMPTSEYATYNRIVQVEDYVVDEVNETVTLEISGDFVLADILADARFLSLTGTTTTEYGTSLTGQYQIEVDNYTNNKVTLQFNPGFLPTQSFLEGTLTFIYEVEAELVADTIPDPIKQVNELFGEYHYPYKFITPLPTLFPPTFPYYVWTLPVWPAGVNAGTDYGKLKQIRQIINAGSINLLYPEAVLIVEDNLRMDISSFNRMMDLFSMLELYLPAPYTAKRPSQEELVELASIFSLSAKKVYAEAWVKEEMEHVPSGAISPLQLRLVSSSFAINMQDPSAGVWDSRLQTIPDSFAEINPLVHRPIIDPELLSRNDIQEGVGQESFFTIYDNRKTELDLKNSFYSAYLTPYNGSGIEDILNEINTGSLSGDYMPNIFPYDSLAAILEAMESGDAFKKQSAENVVWNAFGMRGEQFAQMMQIKAAYENPNPALHPNDFDLQKLIKILVTAHKVKQRYFGATGWINIEIGAVGIGSTKYYEVLKMRLAPVRGDVYQRSIWQRTLTSWNQCPVVEPDVVRAEDIKSFVSGNAVHDEWVSFWNELYAQASNFDDKGLYEKIKARINSTISPVATLKSNFEKLICYSFFNTSIDDSAYASNITYFKAIKEREEAGEDIRRRLTYLGVTITQYRTLARVYDVIEETLTSSAPLIQSEYDEVCDIFLNILKQKQVYGPRRIGQFDAGIILSGDEFKEYVQSPVNFPLTDLTVYNELRYPLKARKEWLDLLDARNELEKNNIEWWKDVLEQTEDRTMRVLRDGLITALGRECEPFDQTAERLAKTLFIETKDNCCVKHTRVSQAIETLQGFLFSLKSGIYDNYLTGFSLSANDFEEEWKWLGSYATWRAAMLTYLYPENLLYPTLRRKQSPGFRKLAQKLQDSSRFTPEQACMLAKEYEGYFEDICDLNMLFTVSAWATTVKDGTDSCCEESTENQYTDFFFAKSRITGKYYWSNKLHSDNNGQTHSFWNELPVDRNAKLLGCFPIDRSVETGKALWLYYSYMDGEVLKVAYIKKRLDSLDDWGEQFDVEDLPTDLGNERIGNAYSIIACQSSIAWDWPSFIISYRNPGIVLKREGSYVYPDLHLHLRYFEHLNKWEPFGTLHAGNHIVDSELETPIAAIRHSSGSGSTENKYALTIFFKSKFHVINFSETMWGKTYPYQGYIIDSLFGVFQSRVTKNAVDIIYKEMWSGITKHMEIRLESSGTDFNITHSSPVPYTYYGLLSIVPVFSQNEKAALGLNIAGKKCYSVNAKYTLGKLSFINSINLVSGYVKKVAIQSGDCVEDFAQRKLLVENNYKHNIYAFDGSTTLGVRQSPIAAEYISEAYYFVPLLLAMDQQQRGQYEAALDWYRTIYDYTISGNSPKRKIYYGLIREESLQNVYNRPSNWLLDPLNPHLIAKTRANAYTKYTVMNIIQCMQAYADREFTLDTIESVPRARILYTTSLELLGIKELKLALNPCLSLTTCFPTTVSYTDTQWHNLFTELQGQMSEIGRVGLIDEVRQMVIDVFENEESDTLQKFTEAFQLVKDAKQPYVSEDIETWISSSTSAYTDLFRYLSAMPAIQAPLKELSDSSLVDYTTAMADILKVEPEELQTTSAMKRMQWLGTDLDITEAYKFEFAGPEGRQYLKGTNAYNPLLPTTEAYTSNLVYTNAAATASISASKGPVYFPLVDFKYCQPKNPIYTSLELKSNLELYKIQNCRNIAGMVRELDVYAAPTDSTTGIPVIGASGNLVLPGLMNFSPSQYRFRVLIGRAKEIASQAQQLESQFLSIMEKRDAEYYSQLKAQQDLQTAKSTIKLQDLRIKQAGSERDLANLQLDRANFTQANFDSLISMGLSSFESQSAQLLQTSSILLSISAATGLSGSVAASFDPRGSAAAILNIITGGLRDTATALSSISSYMSQMASYERRMQEWEYQKDLAGHDVKIAGQQIKISEDNIRIVSQEREISQLNANNAQDTLEFIKSKFTNAELYNWMSNVLERAYSYMLNLSTSVARTAEGQLYFERQEQAGPFILNDYWETPNDSYGVSGSGNTAPDRRGLTGSARLLQDIYRLDQFAFETDKRKLQLTKTISLAQEFPIEFQRFKETGVLNFELTNKLFDYDFPGNYLRLIRSVKTSVIGLVPVYGGIKATLTAEPTSYTVTGGVMFQRTPIKRLEIDTVALTSPSSSNGLFEMQQTEGEMLNPFEGMGVESRWEFKMPKFSNRMNYDHVADVLITLDYTALDSFQYRYQVLQELNPTLSFNRAFSFKNNFPDQWFDLANVGDDASVISVTFNTKKEDFPQGFSEIRSGGRITLYFVREEGYTDEIVVRDFRLVSNMGGNNLSTNNTVNGIYNASMAAQALGSGSPFRTWQLQFDNTIENRELFAGGHIKDILFVITCVGDLPAYPL